MADVLHHPNTHHLDGHTGEVPGRIFLAAGIGIVLVALLLAFSVTTASNPAGSTAPLSDMPFLPLMPLL